MTILIHRVHLGRHVSLAIKAACIALGALFFYLPHVAVAQEPLSAQARLALVNPFIGTGPDGHTFPGATVPFGMVQLSPDTQIRPFKQSYKWASGYRYEDTTILGFSHTHFSGSGHSDLGDVLLQPISGDVQLEPGDIEKPESGYRSRFSHKQERAEPGYYAVDLLISGMIGQYIHGNEPSHHLAYLYDYAGEPARTQERLRQIVESQYRPAPDGLVGNDDLGQMSAWLIFTSLGFYPVAPGSNEYVIGRPFVEETTLHLPNGKTFKVVAENLSPLHAFIRSVTLNGKPLTRMVPLEQIVVPGGVTFEVRTARSAWAEAPSVIRAVAQVDGRLSLSGVKTLNEQMDDSLVQERMVASVAGLFGILAVLLASVGLYGVMAYTVSRRTNEIGIRMALGSGRVQIAGMILREALLMVLGGLALGIPAAMATAHLMRGQLYGLGPYDPKTMLFAVGTIMGVAVLACYPPATRAMRIDPMAALRYE